MTYLDLYLEIYSEAKLKTCKHGTCAATCNSSECHIWTPEEMEVNPDATIPENELAAFRDM